MLELGARSGGPEAFAASGPDSDPFAALEVGTASWELLLEWEGLVVGVGMGVMDDEEDAAADSAVPARPRRGWGAAPTTDMAGGRACKPCGTRRFECA